MSEAARPTIDAALAARLVAAQFPRWAHLPVTPVKVGGWDNRTFHLGEDMVLRLPTAERYAASVAREQRWLPVLATALPLEIPAPLAHGAPAEGYPWPWSVYRWIEGETVIAAGLGDPAVFGSDLGAFLAALHAADATDGPPAGPENFHRGGALAVYDAQTRAALARLEGRLDTRAAAAAWEAALATEWAGPPVWVHGDIAAGNLLMRDGRLRAAIDFGQFCVGDPACDLAIAWTYLDAAGRAALRAALPLDAGTWARGRAWSLWKASILFSGLTTGLPRDVADAGRVLDVILAEIGAQTPGQGSGRDGAGS